MTQSNEDNKDVSEVLESPEMDVVESPELVEEVNSEEPVELVQKAKSTGHLTKDQYQSKFGSLAGYKSEEEFVRTGDMIEQIYSLRKELKKRDTEVDAILKYQQDTIEQVKVKARQELDHKLAEAKEYGNVEAVEQYTRQKTAMELKDYQDKQNATVQEHGNVVSNFVERNKHWYNDQHPDLVQRCHQLDAEIVSYHNANRIPLSADMLAQQIELRMKYEFPDVVNTGVKARSIPMTSSNSNVNKSVASSNDSESKMYSKLSNDEKNMYSAQKRFMDKQGIPYNVKKFVDKIHKDKEI